MTIVLFIGAVYGQKKVEAGKEIKIEDRKVAVYESVEISGLIISYSLKVK